VLQPVVEDALRARAEQAQSAAERLLELVEPEDEVAHPQPSLLLNNGTASQKAKIQVSTQTAQKRTPTTPVSKNTAIWKQAAAFRDSPAHQAAPSLMTDMLRPTTTRADGAWWKKRMARMCRCSFYSLFLRSTFLLQCSINAILFLLPALLMRPQNCRDISPRSTRAPGMYRH